MLDPVRTRDIAEMSVAELALEHTLLLLLYAPAGFKCDAYYPLQVVIRDRRILVEKESVFFQVELSAQELQLIRKIGGRPAVTVLEGCRFVPLVEGNPGSG